MTLKELRPLVAFMRRTGVISLTDGPVSLVLGDPPPPRHRRREQPEPEPEPGPESLLLRIHEANYRRRP